MLTLREAGSDALFKARERALAEVDPALGPYMLKDERPLHLAYPLPSVPHKLVNVPLDKLNEIDGRLLGVKGQYLVWADGRVLNVRNHTGYHVEVE